MTAWMLTWVWQGTALVLGVSLALRAAPRLNAATRHLIWCAALVALTWLGWVSSPFAAVTALKGCATAGFDAAGGGQAAGGTGLQPCPLDAVAYVPSAPDVFVSIFIGIWAAIALVYLLRLLPGLHAVYVLRDRCRPFPPQIEARLPLWLEAQRGGRRADLMVCDHVPGATVLGFQRPCIAIPSSLLQAMTTDELDQVILHEHAHVQRRDDWSRLVEQLFLAVLWIHPAALHAARMLNREREMACDEWVVARTGHAKAYARCLARAAEVRGRISTRSMLLPALLGGRHELMRRVERLLSMKGAARRKVSVAGATVAMCVIALTSAHLQGLRFAEIADLVIPHVPEPIARLAPTVRLKPDTTDVARAFDVGVAPDEPGAPIAPSTPGLEPTSQIASLDVPSVPVELLEARTFHASYTSAIAPPSQIATADRSIAPPSQIATADRSIAPSSQIATPLDAAQGASSVSRGAVDKPNPWAAMVAPSVEIASAAKKTSLGVASFFSRAGSSLARSF